MSSPSFASRHPILTMIGALIVLGLIVEYWMVIVGALILAAVVYGVSRWWEQEQHRRLLQKNEDAAIASRADYEHHLYMNGDPKGLYGQFPPSV
ncbi:hypothetical protein ACQKGB_29130 [Bacillus tropicus]|uniref:hypothetical protein n=1 Tax=Bacillus tropicus TaxID=2026188 RepID=UPI003D014945